MAFTDFLDGYIARKYNLTSYLGGILDVLADKILFLSSAFSIMYFHKNFFIYFYIILIRDLSVYAIRIYAEKHGISIFPNKIAKTKTFALFLIMIIFYFSKQYIENYNVHIIFIVICINSIISMYEYFQILYLNKKNI